MSNDTRNRPMTAETIHTCSYYCERPECIRRQRDELVSRLEALTAAQQPAEGEEIMVNTPYDVFILPLRPSGLDGNGPRFVVHVPGPEQPAAVVDEAAVRRVIAELRAYNPAADEYKGAHIHKVWARELAAALAAQQQEPKS